MLFTLLCAILLGGLTVEQHLLFRICICIIESCALPRPFGFALPGGGGFGERGYNASVGIRGEVLFEQGGKVAGKFYELEYKADDQHIEGYRRVTRGWVRGDSRYIGPDARAFSLDEGVRVLHPGQMTKVLWHDARSGERHEISNGQGRRATYAALATVKVSLDPPPLHMSIRSQKVDSLYQDTLTSSSPLFDPLNSFPKSPPLPLFTRSLPNLPTDKLAEIHTAINLGQPRLAMAPHQVPILDVGPVGSRISRIKGAHSLAFAFTVRLLRRPRVIQLLRDIQNPHARRTRPSVIVVHRLFSAEEDARDQLDWAVGIRGLAGRRRVRDRCRGGSGVRVRTRVCGGSARCGTAVVRLGYRVARPDARVS